MKSVGTQTAVEDRVYTYVYNAQTQTPRRYTLPPRRKVAMARECRLTNRLTIGNY